MPLISSCRRRTTGFTGLLAALLLVLIAILVASPAGSREAQQTCKDLAGYRTNSMDDTGGPWGSIEFTSDNGPLVLTVNDGYAVALCLKKGSASSGGGPLESSANPYIGPIIDVDVVYPGHNDMNHYSYRLIDVAAPEQPTFVNPDCEAPDAAAVNLPETEGVDYSYEASDVAPGGTVTVSAIPQAGYVFKGDAVAEWAHHFAERPEDCDEPTEVAPATPTFTDPTCDVTSVGLEVPDDTDGVTYTIAGGAEPGETVTVIATVADGYTLGDDAEVEWEHTYGEVPTNCGGVGGSVTDPDASVRVDCDGDNQIVLDNTGSDVDVTYTITGVDGYGPVVVAAGQQQRIEDLGITEDADYDIAVRANGMDDAVAEGTYDCATTTPPTTEVSPDMDEEPAPTTAVLSDAVEKPAPDPAPAVAAAAEELPATGLGSTELLVLALLLGLGTAALRGSDPRREH